MCLTVLLRLRGDSHRLPARRPCAAPLARCRHAHAKLNFTTSDSPSRLDDLIDSLSACIFYIQPLRNARRQFLLGMYILMTDPRHTYIVMCLPEQRSGQLAYGSPGFQLRPQLSYVGCDLQPALDRCGRSSLSDFSREKSMATYLRSGLRTISRRLPCTRGL